MRCNNAVQKSPVAWEAFELGKRAGLFFASYYVAIEALKGQRAAKGQAQPTHGSVMNARTPLSGSEDVWNTWWCGYTTSPTPTIQCMDSIRSMMPRRSIRN